MLFYGENLELSVFMLESQSFPNPQEKYGCSREQYWCSRVYNGWSREFKCVLRAPVPDSLGLSRFGAHRLGGRRDPHRDIERPVL
jgi:hypothetical protein